MSDARLTFKTTDDQLAEVGAIGFWAAGNYMNRCMDCGNTFQGDKRAIKCLPCAVKCPRAATPAEAARVLLDADGVLDKITLMILGKKTEHTPNLDYVAQRVMKKSDWCKQVEAALRAIADGGDDE